MFNLHHVRSSMGYLFINFAMRQSRDRSRRIMEDEDIDTILDMLNKLIQVSDDKSREMMGEGSHMQSYHAGEANAYRTMWKMFADLRNEE